MTAKARGLLILLALGLAVLTIVMLAVSQREYERRPGIEQKAE